MIDWNVATRQTEIYFQPGKGFRGMFWASAVCSKSDPSNSDRAKKGQPWSWQTQGNEERPEHEGDSRMVPWFQRPRTELLKALRGQEGREK